MGFLTKAFEKRTSLENPSVSLHDPDAWADLFGGGQTKSGVRVTNRKALGHPPLWRGVNLIANVVSKLALNTYRRTDGSGRELDTDHPAYRLLKRKPNKFIMTGVFKKTLTYHAVLYGNGYAVIFRDGRGRPQELMILSPFETFPFQAGGKLWYRTRIGNEQRRIPAEDVLHIRGLSFDGLVGHSVIEVMAEALGTGIAARDFASRFFGQGANASGILMIPGHLKKDAISEVIKDFEKIASGVKNQHKVGLLQDGVQWIKMGVDPDKSQLLATREFEAREVANILGLPPHKLGDPSRTSFSSLEQENQSFLDESMDPWLCTWEDEVWDKLLSEAEKETDSHFFEFNRAALLKTDLLTRYRAYAVGRQWGWLSANDINSKENQPGIGPQGDIYLSPQNMVPADKADALAEDQIGDSVQEASRDAVFERLERLRKIETEQVRRAAERGGNFVNWLEKFYGQHEQRITEALTPLLRVWFMARNKDADAFGLADEIAEQSVSRSKQELLTVAGKSTAKSLAHNVSAWCDHKENEPLDELDGGK